ncbi:hypothetical protein MTO96_020134 [Rhipicephalus appendiculatus]
MFSAVTTKPPDKKNRLLAVGFCLALVGALLIILLVFTDFLSSSAPQAAGDEENDDATNRPQSYAVAQRKGTATETTMSTKRPIPAHTLVCTYGPAITEASPFPEDGVCDYTVLEEMPSTVPRDFGEPFPAGVQHFVETAATYEKTEFVAAFDYNLRKKTALASKDPSVKTHLRALFAKRVFHYGYINTDTYSFSKDDMALLMRILKRLTGYLEDKKTPDRPIYTFMSSAWSPFYDEVSASHVAEVSRTILMPDMFISKAHIYEADSIYKDCKILPANLLKEPENLKDENVYFYTLYSALKHISDLDKLRNKGVKTVAFSVSVGLYGRWYHVNTDNDESVQNYEPGDSCFWQFIPEQMAGIATVCKNPKYNDVLKSEEMSCSYVVDYKKAMTFVYDTPTTIKYKLCLSNRNVTGLQYGNHGGTTGIFRCQRPLRFGQVSNADRPLRRRSCSSRTTTRPLVPTRTVCQMGARLKITK